MPEELVQKMIRRPDGTLATYWVKADHRRFGVGTKVTALAMIPLAAVGLSGCVASADTTPAPSATGNSRTDTPKPSESAKPAPVSAPAFKVGVTLTKDAALKLRQDMPANGDYAYLMPDGSWVATNTNQPLPAPVVADQQAKAAAVATPQGSSMQASIDGTQAAVKYVSQYEYATGKQVAYVSLQLRSLVTSNGGTNAPTWTIIGGLNTGDTFPSAQAAEQSAATRIAAQSNPGNWEIVVKQ